MFFREVKFPQRGNLARLYCSLPSPDGYREEEPCPLAIKTPFKTSFGSFVSKCGMIEEIEWNWLKFIHFLI